MGLHASCEVVLCWGTRKLLQEIPNTVGILGEAADHRTRNNCHFAPFKRLKETGKQERVRKDDRSRVEKPSAWDWVDAVRDG